MLINISYYSWACSSVIFMWKWGIWVIILKRICFCDSESFYRWWGITRPMDAPTKVTRWDGRTFHGISITLSIAFPIWQGQAPLNIWRCSSLEKYAFGGMFPCTICLSSLLSLLIMTQTPHFHALSHGNRWTAGSTVITAIVGTEMNIYIAWHDKRIIHYKALMPFKFNMLEIHNPQRSVMHQSFETQLWAVWKSENQATKKWKRVFTPTPRETIAGEYEVIVPTFPQPCPGWGGWGVSNDWCIKA